MRACHENAVRRIEIELVDRDDRESCPQRAPMAAAVIRHETAHVGADVERVRERRVEDDRVDRAVRQVAADVDPPRAGLRRLEDVSGRRGRRGVEASVDRELLDGPVRQHPAPAVDAGPGGIGVRLGIRAQVDEPVLRAGVDGISTADTDRRQEAAARAVRRRAGAPAGEIGANCLPRHGRGRRGLGAVRPVQPVRTQEQLARVELVHHPRDVEGRAVAQVDPVRDRLVGEEAEAAVGEAVRRDPKEGAVHVVGVRRVDQHLSAVSARDVEPALAVDRLAQRPVVLRPAPEALRVEAGRDRGHVGGRGELSDGETRAVRHTGGIWVDGAVQVLPVGGAEWVGGLHPASVVRAEPDSAVRTDQHVSEVLRVEGECMEVRVLVPTEVQPRLAAVVRAEDAARRRREAVAELAAHEDHVGICRIGFDHVVVEALRAAVALDGVVDSLRATGPRRQHRPARTFVGRLEDVGRMVSRSVPPAEAGVQHGCLVLRMRQGDRETRLTGSEVRRREPEVRDRRPGRAAVRRLVDRVAPERGVKDLRILWIQL